MTTSREEATAVAEHEVWYVGVGDPEHGERDGQFSAALLGCGCDVDVEALGAEHFTAVVVESFPDEYTLRGAVRRKKLMASIAQSALAKVGEVKRHNPGLRCCLNVRVAPRACLAEPKSNHESTPAAVVVPDADPSQT